MKKFNKIRLISRIVLFGLLFGVNVSAQTEPIMNRLMKCEGQAAVYSVDLNNSARVFIDAQTFFSYGYEFSQIQNVVCDSKIPFKLIGTVENKNGFRFRLLKKVDDPAVFQCVYKTSYYLCDKIPNEQEAMRLFGSNWSSQVYETSDRALDMLVWHWVKK